MVLRQDLDRESGAVAITVALVAVVLLGVSALVVDIGHASVQRRQAQSAADSAALLAASQVGAGRPAADVVTAVKTLVQTNFAIAPAEWDGCSDSSALPTTPDLAHSNTCISWDTTRALVQVRLPVTQAAAGFAAVFGVSEIAIHGDAQASWGSGGCVVCVLGDYDGQNGTLAVTGGGVAIGGNASLNPQGAITGTSVGIVGTFPSKGTVSPAATHVPAFTDPLVSLPLPPMTLPAAAAIGSNACTPGAYHSVEDCTSFASGVYVISSTSKLAGKGNVTATNVLFYLTCETEGGTKKNPTYTARACAPNEAGATIDGAGNGTFSITGMSSGPYLGLALVFDRNNTVTHKLTGNAGSTLNGGIYGANVTLDNRGTGSAGGMSVTGWLVVKSVAFSGQDQITVNIAGYSPVTLVKPAYLTQ